MSVASLIGMPWALPCDPPRSFDCWELAVIAREHLGRPTPSCAVPVDRRGLGDRQLFETPDASLWKQLDGPVEGCLVGFGTPTKHCGVYIQGKVMHSYSGDNLTGSVCLHGVGVLERIMGVAKYWEARSCL